MKHIEAVDKALDEQVVELIDRSKLDKGERIERQKMLLEKRKALVAVIEPKLTVDRTAADQSAIIVSMQFQRKAELKGWNVSEIISFYRKLKTIVENGLMR